MKTDFTSWFFAKKKKKKIASSFNSLKFLKFSRIPSKIFTMKDTSHSYYEKSLQRFPIFEPSNQSFETADTVERCK